MRRSIAFCALMTLGMSPLLLQCTDEPRYSEETPNTGKLSLPLQAFGQSGNLYRLRDAVFLVERRVGEGSADNVSATTITTVGGFTGVTGSFVGGVSGVGGGTGGTGGFVSGVGGGTGGTGGFVSGVGGGTGGTGGFASGVGGGTGGTGSTGGGTGGTGATGSTGGSGGYGASGGTGATGGTGASSDGNATGGTGSVSSASSGTTRGSGSAITTGGTSTTGGTTRGSGSSASASGSGGTTRGPGTASSTGSTTRGPVSTTTSTTGVGGGGFGVGGSGGSAGAAGFGGFGASGGFGGGSGEFELETILFSEDNLDQFELITRLRSGDYRITLQPGWIMERITPDGQTDFIQSDLLSSDQQFFEIISNGTSFVFYEFLVDGDQIIFGREGDLIVGIGVTEVNNTPFNRRSLIETSKDAVAQVSLEDTLDALSANAGMPANGQTLYHQLIDSYASAGNGRLESAVHCGEENPQGDPTLNGYPILCDRLEAQQFDNLGSWFATAFVNRIDLAPANGAHCGQQRIIFANNELIGNQRMFIIIEPQIPNPTPDLGIEGCRPIAEFWRSLESVDDPTLRGLILNDAFLGGGLPGFGAFMNASRVTAGTGQIRTNNFNHFFWTLREFKAVEGEGAVSLVPFPTAEAPHGALWNDLTEFAAGEACRENLLQAIDGLLSNDPAEMALIVNHECKDAESPNDGFTQNYPLHLAEGSGEFEAQLAERLEGTGLSPSDIATRAQFAGSCIGCHEEAIGRDLGNGVISPFSNGFVHVDEFFEDSCNGEPCFAISPALRDVFLPNRAEVMQELLGETGEGGAGGQSGEGGFGGMVDGVVTTTGFVTTGGMIPGEQGLASAELTPEELAAEDEALKSGWGDETLGGQPAKVSH